MNSEKNASGFWQSFGPGILFAGAAIGTSHLVQSTRAGAVFGLGLLGIVVFANIIKYPAFRFGPQYAAATGTSILYGYRDIGRGVLALFLFSQLAVTAIIIAATAVVTAAVLLASFNVDSDAKIVGVGLIATGGIVLTVGGFKLLDQLTKVFVGILTVATVFSTLLTLPSIEWDFAQIFFPVDDIKTFAFVIALMGFMPAAIDLSVLQSLWAVEKQKSLSSKPSMKHAMADFNFGYFATALLAICFVLMGAGVMHTTGEVPAASAADFAKQVIGLYTHNLGSWAGIAVGIAAMFVMFSTLLTALDGFSRLLASGIELTRKTQVPSTPTKLIYVSQTACMVFLGLAASSVLLFLTGSFKVFIDFVTITAFTVSPIAALLNHLSITSAAVPDHLQPSNFMKTWSLIGITILGGLSVTFIYIRFA